MHPAVLEKLFRDQYRDVYISVVQIMHVPPNVPVRDVNIRIGEVHYKLLESCLEALLNRRLPLDKFLDEMTNYRSSQQ